ncbi:hypothetical protein ACHAPT_000130 [Fusarium lateritium]
MFRQITLKCDLSTPPTGREFEMFLRTAHKLIRGEGSDGAIAYKYYEDSVIWIRKWCVFRYRDFKLDAHDLSRIEYTFKDLHREGVLTKEGSRSDKHWITSDMIGMMLKAMLQDGIQNGTLSWDVLIMKAVSLLLQCVVGSRAGDIRRSALYEGVECLRWEHIHMILDPSDGKNLFRSTIELVFVKGFWNNPKSARAIEIEEFDDPSLNCLCPLKLLLCHALRTGAVHETSWAELRQASKERPNKRVIWAHPKRPVICAIAGNSKKLLLDKPSPVGAGLAVLRQAAQLTGLLAKVRTHDIRRGAARQSAHLQNAIAGYAVEQGRIAIGHSIKARDSGATEEYIGHLDDQNWSNRAKQKLRQTAKHQLDFAPEAYQPKRKRTTQEIDQTCREMGLDPNVKKNRMRASRRFRDTEYNDWLDSELAKAGTRSSGNPNPSGSAQAMSGDGSNADEQTRPSLSLEVNIPSTRKTRSSGLNSSGEEAATTSDRHRAPLSTLDLNIPLQRRLSNPSRSNDKMVAPHDQMTTRGLLPSALPSSTDVAPLPNGYQTDKDDQIPMSATREGEEEEQQYLPEVPEVQALHDYVFDGDTESIANAAEVVAVLTEDIETISSSADTGSIIDASPAAFADYFASVNVCRWENPVHGLPPCAGQTGSKEVPTRFMYHCPVAPCDQTFLTRVKRDEHSLHCQADVTQFFDIACSICGKKYPTEETLNVHMAEHNWTPRTCPWPDCEDMTVFQTRNQLRLHNSQVHQDLPTECWICDNSYNAPSSLKKHVREMHPEVTEEELDEIMPNQKRQAHKQDAFKPQRCSFPGCTYQTVFGSRSQYRDHLKKHSAKGSMLDQYVQDNPEELRPTTPPRTRAANFQPQRCTHPDCSCQQTFGHRHKLAAHLQEHHGVWKDEDIALFVRPDSPSASDSEDDSEPAQASSPLVPSGRGRPSRSSDDTRPGQPDAAIVNSGTEPAQASSSLVPSGQEYPSRSVVTWGFSWLGQPDAGTVNNSGNPDPLRAFGPDDDYYPEDTASDEDEDDTEFDTEFEAESPSGPEDGDSDLDME